MRDEKDERDERSAVVCLLIARLFGAKVIPIKPIMKEFPPWFENRDKAVRTEASLMVVEMYRWLGKALTPAVEALNPVQVSFLLSR